MVIRAKLPIVFCVVIFIALGIGIATGVISSKEFSKKHNSEDIIYEDLSDYIMVCYCYQNGETVFIPAPLLGCYSLYNDAEIIITAKNKYCIKNWDYKILYSLPDFPNKMIPREEF